MDEEAHEEHQEAEVVSVLAEEAAGEVVASQGVVAAALLQEDEALREVFFHGDVVDRLLLRLACIDIAAFSGLPIRCLVAIGWVQESKLWSYSAVRIV